MALDESQDRKLINATRTNDQQKPRKHQDDGEDLTAINKADLSCYENTIDCCGSFWGCWRAWLPCVCCLCPYPYKQINQGQKGLLQKFGKFQRILDPGLHEINPCSERVISVSTKTFVIELQRQLILSKDNITTDIDTIVYYRLVDVIKSTYKVKNIVQSIMEITYATLRTVCGEHTLQDIIEHRQLIADEIEAQVINNVTEWGVYVEQVFIKDMVMSDTLQSSLSMAPKAKRVAESKIISAKSDVEAAKLLREASDMLDSRAAMQIRYFETIQGIAKGNNQKILFLPLHADEKQQQKK